MLKKGHIRTLSVVVAIVLGAAVTIAVSCMLILRYDPPLFGLLLTKWASRKITAMWIVPTPLTDVSIDRSPGDTFSYLGYELEWPWNDVKKVTKGESIVTINFSNGEVISISSGAASDLEAMKMEFAKRGVDLRKLFNDEVISSNYALCSKILYMAPGDLRLFSSRHEMAVNQILFDLKAAEIIYAANGMYSFQTEAFHGFELRSPLKTSAIHIIAYDSADREVTLIIRAQTISYRRPSQAEVNRILFSLRTAPVSSTN